ncbi:hypothetical protein PR002_g951 [Phytophthora rubi]|uniref:EF-1-gamma C-terminal domain-containing protein n=1 Tax=Phytophthora rubi TaxID=129364 RepID=A0A6A3NWJ3_9STRA|nr:hypothetical protein PR002_g951 [Phytophthora rubi]
MKWFWEKLGAEGYLLWFCYYNYNRENIKMFMTCNAVGGFLQRSGATRKFAVAAVLAWHKRNIPRGNPTYVLDCIDEIKTKCALLESVMRKNLKAIPAIGASAKADTTRLQIAGPAVVAAVFRFVPAKFPGRRGHRAQHGDHADAEFSTMPNFSGICAFSASRGSSLHALFSLEKRVAISDDDIYIFFKTYRIFVASGSPTQQHQHTISVSANHPTGKTSFFPTYGQHL